MKSCIDSGLLMLTQMEMAESQEAMPPSSSLYPICLAFNSSRFVELIIDEPNQEQFKQVWSIADSKRQGFLGFNEFIAAMQLVSLAQAGHEITENVLKSTENISTCELVGEGLLDIVICQRYSGRIPSFESMENAIGRKIDSSILIMEKDEDIELILAKAPEKMKKIVFGNYVPKAKDLSLAEIVLVYKVARGAASISS